MNAWLETEWAGVAKDLCHSRPLGLQPGIHLSTRPDFSLFEPSMPFLHAFGILPLLLLGIRIVKESHQVLIHLRVILFHNGQVIPLIGMHPSAPLLLGMHGIGTQKPSFHQGGMNEGRRRTDLIFFLLARPVRQNDATVAFIEREQMDQGLPLALVSERAT